MTNQGVFIVLEGADGSGKGTQFKLLAERLKAVGYDVEVFDFPRYDEPSSHFVRSYLNGEYGDAANISPYTASLFFALDRFEASPKIKKALRQGKIVLSNRYVGSNMAHQGGKFTNSGEQRGFFIWEDGLEFELLGIPRPTTNIFLRVPAEVSFELIGKKAKRSYTDQTHDQHENDINHLKNSVAAYDTLCQLFPKDFKAIECAPDGKLMSIADINDRIWEMIKPILPPKPPHSARDVVVQLDESRDENSNLKEQAKIEENKLPTNTPEKESSGNLIIHVKKVSMLAANRVQALADIDCEVVSNQWPENGNYNFYTPSGVSKKILIQYRQSLEKIAQLHKQMLEDATKNHNQKLLGDTLDTVVPVSALTTIKISGNPLVISNLIEQLRLSPLSEVRWLAEQLQVASNRMRPGMFSGELLQQNILSAQNGALSKIASKNLSQNAYASNEQATLQEAWPRNEFALLVDALYPYSTSSRSDISTDLESWTYDQKRKAFLAALEEENSPILELARYRWNVIADSKTFNELKQTINARELQIQPNTPRYGYEIPEDIEAAGIEKLYIECFDESMKLYSALQESGHEHLAEYATLYGHKNRWQFSNNAKSFKRSSLQPTSTTVMGILEVMNEKIAEHHPLIGTSIISPPAETSVNKLVEPEKKLETVKKLSGHHRRRSRRPKK